MIHRRQKQFLMVALGVLLLSLGIVSVNWSRARGAAALPPLQGQAAIDALKQHGQYASLQQAMESAQYGAHAEPQRGGEFMALNPAQGFHSRFTPQGVELRRRGDDQSPQLAMTLRSAGYGERLVPVISGTVAAQDQRIEIHHTLSTQHSALTEWYVNRPSGLEQGFTIAVPPGKRQAGEWLRLTLELSGALQAHASEDGQAVEFRDAAGIGTMRYDHLAVRDAKGRTLPARMRLDRRELRLEVEDTGAVWPVTIDPMISQQAYLKASNTQANDRFGNSVGISGDTVVVGAFLENSNTTGVNSTPNEAAGDSGAAYVFVRSGTTWIQQAYLKASNTGANDHFGLSVAISGDTLVVGANFEDSGTTGVNSTPNEGATDSGAAYVFVRSGTMWTQQAYLKASNPGPGDGFGFSVAVSGNTVMVGAPNEDSGAAYVFVPGETTWIQQAYLKASDSGPGDGFGGSVAISGDTVVAGAIYESSNTTGVNSTPNEGATGSGAAYVFVRTGTAWIQQAYLKASNTGAYNYFGWSVAISGETLVIGTPYEGSSTTGIIGIPNEGASNSGAAYVFVRDGTMWTQQAYLKASNTRIGDLFGGSVAISGEMVVVGAIGQDSSEFDPQHGSGAAYVFVRSGTWTEQTYLKGSNTELDDGFGVSVAVSGDTVVAGASGEDSNARGVNAPLMGGSGTQANNSALSAGAAYVFTRNSPPILSPLTVTRTAGNPGANSQIAIALDMQDAEDILHIQISSGGPFSDSATLNNVTVTLTDQSAGAANVNPNETGQVFATVEAACDATNAAFILRVTDSDGLMTDIPFTVTVNPNTPPVLSYSPQTVTAGTTPTINPATGPSHDSLINSLILQSISPSSGLTLNLNPTSGQIIVASATIPNTYTAMVSATDNCGITTNASFTVTVVCPTITFSPVALPSATAGIAYSQTIAASPAGGNYPLSVTGGLLPAGLTLNSNGSFSGAPAQSGIFHFRVTASGFGSCSGFSDYVLIVNCPTITLAPANLPGGTVGAAYNQNISATPSGSYSYSVTSGALPNGLVLNAGTAAITGTPTTGGTFSFRVVATSGSCSGAYDYTVTIACASATITTISLPAGTAGNAYSQTIGVNPAAPAGSYNFTLLTGSLPNGLTLNAATGALGGLPSVTGSYNFTIKATAANACAATQSYTLAINCPSVTLSALATPILNSTYNQSVSVLPSGGNYNFAVTMGTLLAGLSLNAATGLISGTPTTAGAYNFTITVTGFGTCMGSRAYTGTIAGSTCPSVMLPELPSGAPGQLYSNSVTATPAGTYSYAVTSGGLPPGLTLYGSFGLVYGYPTTAGNYSFTITATSNNCTSSKSYNLTIGGAASHSLVFGDFDGDGRADLSVWRGQEGNWLTVNSGNGQLQTSQWGSTAAPYFDVMTPGDYDGDGKMDLAVFRRGSQIGQGGQWLIKGSQDGAVTSKIWGVATDVPVPGDYDGDGKTDIAVWRGAESNWYILRSSDGQIETISWGTSRAPYRDVPVPTDYDGDGKTDIAVFRQQNGHWYIRLSSEGSVLDKAWGLGTDVPVAADYDGDGKADIAVWRGTETNWYILRSSDGVVQSVLWGTSNLGDVPVPGDYDGDGKADVAVWRATEGGWNIQCSRDWKTVTAAHGAPGDSPVTASPKR